MAFSRHFGVLYFRRRVFAPPTGPTSRCVSSGSRTAAWAGGPYYHPAPLLFPTSANLRPRTLMHFRRDLSPGFGRLSGVGEGDWVYVGMRLCACLERRLQLPAWRVEKLPDLNAWKLDEQANRRRTVVACSPPLPGQEKGFWDWCTRPYAVGPARIT